MATTKTFPVTKDARIARRESDNWDAGSGKSTGLPYGLYSGYRYRTLLGFSINMSGWTSITSATLKYRSSNQIAVAFGSDPTFRVDRITTSWSEGSSDGLSASNAVIYPGPSISTTNNVIEDAPTAENTWGAVSITAMMRDVLAGSAFQGLRIIGCDNSGVESDSSANVGEIYSREQGSDAYIEIVYETNQAPNTPVITVAGESGGIVNDLNPDLSFTLDDPDSGDVLTQYQWQVASDSAFTTLLDDHTVAGSFAQGTVINVATVALTRGQTVYARARAYDGTVWGAYSATKTIKVASNPTVAVTDPSASGRLGKVTYDPGSGWASPRLNVAWSFACPDGGTQASYRVEVNSDAAGAVGAIFNDSGTLAEPATRARIVPATFVEGAYYHVRVTATCSHGVAVTTGYFRIRVRWGVVTHAFNMGPGLTSLNLSTLDVTDETTGGAGRVTMEYATVAAAPPTGPGSWQASIAAAGLNQYLWYRAWLLAWGASPAVSPTLNELKVTYSSIQIVPDKWNRTDAGNQAGDSGAYVYGTKSFRMLGKGVKHTVWQEVPVNTDTWYVLSGRIQSLGDSGAYISLASDATTGADLAGTTPLHVTGEFEDTDKSRVFTVPLYSGSNTSIFIRLNVTGAVGTMAWFDALKLEASTVVTPWSPGYIADAVVLDSGGLQIDGLAGGIFRLRGNAGGSRDEITLGDHGLKFGGDTEIASPSDGVITVDGNPIATTGPAPIRRIYTASSTWTVPPGLSHVEVEVVGGGGGGAGAPATIAGQGSSGSGGGGGGYARRIITAAELLAAGLGTGGVCPITVGAAGAAGVGGADGGVGGTSTFAWGTGTSISGTGGVGGNFIVSATNSNNSGGGAGGNGSGDAFTERSFGSYGESGYTQAGQASLNNGGASRMGGGGRGGRNAPGSPPSGYGGGGGGAANSNAQTLTNGGNAAPGLVLVTEYYSGVPAGSVVPIVSQGFAFPPGPSLDDRFYHLGLHMEFFWNGARWLSSELFQLNGGEVSPLTGNGPTSRWAVPYLAGCSDIWLEKWEFNWRVAAGGTALGASHKWNLQFKKAPLNAGATVDIAAVLIQSGAVDTWLRAALVDISALINAGTVHTALEVYATKTGTPGSLYGTNSITYRLVG